MLNAGSLLGLTPEMVLEVRQPAGQGLPDTIVGHVRVTQVSAYSAMALACAYNNMAAVEDLPPAGGCQPVFFDFGDMSLKVGVSERDRAGVLVPEMVRESLLRQLSAMTARGGAAFTVTDEAKDAEWLVRIEAKPSKAAYLIEAGHSQSEKPWAWPVVKPPQGIFGPFPTEELPDGTRTTPWPNRTHQESSPCDCRSLGSDGGLGRKEPGSQIEWGQIS